MSKLHGKLEPYQPTDADPFDAVKAAHLLNRASFGGTPDEIDELVKLGLEASVEKLLDFPDSSAEEMDPDDIPDFSQLADYPKNFREIRRMSRGMTEEQRKELLMKFMQANREAMRLTLEWWITRMIAGKHPLHEKLVLFWHGHFTTSARDERSALLMWKQNELLRKMAAGNFRDFVQAISRDPAMLDYLNNTQNHKEHPNENYARELMELFTLGIGNYSEDDVKEAARAFTGWTHDGESFTFNDSAHDHGTKTFLGQRGTFDGDQIVDLIMMQPACPRYVASKIFAFFVTEEIDESLEKSLGKVLIDSKYNLRPLLKAMFMSKVFYSPEVIGAQIKSPLQLVIGTIRQLDLQLPNLILLHGALTQMGQVPFSPPNVKGWPGGRMWINTSTLFVRYNTGIYLAGGAVPVKTGRKFADMRLARRGLTNFTPKGGKDAQEVVDEWIERLIQRPIETDKRQTLVDALQEHPEREDFVRRMVQLIVSMPEYQLC